MNLENLNLLVFLYLHKDPRTMVVIRDSMAQPVLYSQNELGTRERKKDIRRLYSEWDKRTIKDFLDMVIKVADNNDERQRISCKSEGDILRELSLTSDEVDCITENISKQITVMPANPMKINIRHLHLPTRLYNALRNHFITTVGSLYESYCNGTITNVYHISKLSVKAIQDALRFIENVFGVRFDMLHIEDMNPMRIVSTFNLNMVDESKISIEAEPIELEKLNEYQTFVGDLTPKLTAIVEKDLKKTINKIYTRVSLHKGEQVIFVKTKNIALNSHVDYYLVTVK